MAITTYSDLVTNGGRVSQVLSALVQEALYDPTDLRETLVFVPWAGMGSDTMRVTVDEAPGGFAAATSDSVGGVTPTAYTTAKFDLQVARYLRSYQLTDLIGVSGGPINMEGIVKNLMDGVALTMTDITTTLFSAMSSTVSPAAGSTEDLDVGAIYAAQYALNNANNMAGSGYTCVLYPEQMNNFRASLRSESGALQYVPATAEMLATKGPGFQGSWNGIDFYQSDSVPSHAAGASSIGAMYSKGWASYTMAPVRALQGRFIPTDQVIVDAETLIVEIERDATNGLTTAIANLYPAVAEANANRGVGIISDR